MSCLSLYHDTRVQYVCNHGIRFPGRFSRLLKLRFRFFFSGSHHVPWQQKYTKCLWEHSQHQVSCFKQQNSNHIHNNSNMRNTVRPAERQRAPTTKKVDKINYSLVVTPGEFQCLWHSARAWTSGVYPTVLSCPLNLQHPKGENAAVPAKGSWRAVGETHLTCPVTSSITWQCGDLRSLTSRPRG